MTRGGFRVAAAAAAAATFAGIPVIALRATGSGHAAEVSPHPPAPTPCAGTLLADWSDGRIDGTYAIACYRAALRSLPADLEVYSSAADDIAHALSLRIVQGTRQAPAGGDLRRPEG